MAFKSKIKWVALFVLTLSLGSLVAHLSMTKFSSMNLVQYSAKDALSHNFPNIGSSVSFFEFRLQLFYLHVFACMMC